MYFIRVLFERKVQPIVWAKIVNSIESVNQIELAIICVVYVSSQVRFIMWMMNSLRSSLNLIYKFYPVGLIIFVYFLLTRCRWTWQIECLFFFNSKAQICSLRSMFEMFCFFEYLKCVKYIDMSRKLRRLKIAFYVHLTN